jgi:hypothetical protein
VLTFLASLSGIEDEDYLPWVVRQRLEETLDGEQALVTEQTTSFTWRLHDKKTPLEEESS